MDEFKPEDELKPDPSDRRTGRSRQSSERDSEPQINFDDALIWTPTIAVRRVRVKRVVKNLKLKKSTNPMKTIRWTKSVLNAVHVSVKSGP